MTPVYRSDPPHDQKQKDENQDESGIPSTSTTQPLTHTVILLVISYFVLQWCLSQGSPFLWFKRQILWMRADPALCPTEIAHDGPQNGSSCICPPAHVPTPPHCCSYTTGATLTPPGIDVFVSYQSPHLSSTSPTPRVGYDRVSL